MMDTSSLGIMPVSFSIYVGRRMELELAPVSAWLGGLDAVAWWTAPRPSDAAVLPVVTGVLPQYMYSLGLMPLPIGKEAHLRTDLCGTPDREFKGVIP
uniref:Uncharacterized protein n=1 Tax=Oryza meridionalis TaxID=40149 RepID=A0A0E0EN57_9ORYZ